MLGLHLIQSIYSIEWYALANINVSFHHGIIPHFGAWHPLNHDMVFPLKFNVSWHPHGHGIHYRLAELHWAPRNPC